MRFRIKGVEYDSSNIVDAPLDLLFELNRLSGLEGQDVVDGLKESGEALLAGRMPGMRGLMATAALVWLGKAIAGEKVGFEESVAGLSLFDIQQIPDAAPSTAVVEVTPDPPTQPGSVPAIVVEPVPQVSSPSPGVTYPDQSPSTSSSSATSGPE